VLAVFQNHAPDNYDYEAFIGEGFGVSHYYFDYLGATGWHLDKQFLL
jgi:hypothetical protein